MTDILSPEERSAAMSRIRGSDTKPEIAVRSALHAKGYRFRTNVRGLPGTPDVVFSKRRAAIFVHGCFWHRHGCKNTSTPKSRRRFWMEKFAANVERDGHVRALLVREGWRVFVAWECEVERDDSLLDRLVRFLGPPRST